MTEEIRCQKCGTQAKSTSKYCRKCGCELMTKMTKKAPSVTRAMKCAYHPERDAVNVCVECGSHICSMCRTEVFRKTYCPDCVSRLTNKHNEKQHISERKESTTLPRNEPILKEHAHEPSKEASVTQNAEHVDIDGSLKHSSEDNKADKKQNSANTKKKVVNTTKVPFQNYIAQDLTQQLPFVKKGSETKTEGCDWRHLITILEAGFNLGCSFSLTNGTAAQTMLEETAKVSATGKPWETAYSRIIQDLEQKEKMISEFFKSQKQARSLQTSPSDQEILNSTVMSYEFLFPEMRTEEYHSEAIVSRDGCIAAISQEVLLGLIFGIKFPESALLTVKGWIYKKKTWGLTAGGEFSSIKDVFKAMETSYYSWSNKK